MFVGPARPFQTIQRQIELYHRTLEEHGHSRPEDMVIVREFICGNSRDEALVRAGHIVRQRFQVQRIAPAPMEPRGARADYQSQGDLLTVWDSTQLPHEMREHIAHLLGLPGGDPAA